MTIDIHAHVVPDTFIRALRSEVPEVAPEIQSDGDHWFLEYPSGRRSGPMLVGMFDAESRLADMYRQSVSVQALSVPPTHLFYDLPGHRAAVAARLHNDAMIEMARAYPDRFVVLATLPLQSPEAALDELRRLTPEAAVAGLQFGTNVAGVNLDDVSLANVWNAVNDAGMAVILHPDNVAGAERMKQYYLHNFVGNPTDTTIAAASLIFGGVLARNAALRIGLLHGGGFLPYQIGRLEHGWNVRPEPRGLEVNPRRLFRNFHFDTLTHDGMALRFLLERVGADRLCLGSDYPFDMADPEPVRNVSRELQDMDVLDAVLETTPRALLTRTTSRHLVHHSDRGSQGTESL
jgi:aminocarboxymuconate-semialdehyde decarboxylase